MVSVIQASVVCGISFAAAVTPASSGEPPKAAAPGACVFNPIGSGRVVRIGDGRTFTLADGREIKLAAIETPPLWDEAAGPRRTAGDAAKDALSALVLDEVVELRQLRPATDRYGRTVAYVTGHRGEGESVAHALVASGYARMSARVETAACAAELLSRERLARAAKLGLWANPYYGLIMAERGAELLAGRGRFAVAEGKVVSVRESGGTIYVNFGRRWSEALTVTISKRHERIFQAAGLQLKALENRRVRVRGWIDERDGPRIEATRAEQIEIAELN